MSGLMTDGELDEAITSKRRFYLSFARNLPDKGEKLLTALNDLQAEKEHRKRRRLEKENSSTAVNAFPKAPPGYPPCDSHRNGQLSPRPMTLEGHNIGSRTENLSKGSPFHTSPRATKADDNDLDCAMGENHAANKDETRVGEGSSAQVTSFPQLARVVEEMQISLTRMQIQVDRLTEQVGGFAQRLEAYDDHFTTMRRQLDYYFPYPPPPTPRPQ